MSVSPQGLNCAKLSLSTATASAGALLEGTLRYDFLAHGGAGAAVRWSAIPEQWPSESTARRASQRQQECSNVSFELGNATRQLDFVFASRDLIPRLTVRALSSADEWGPSDHCRIEIGLDES